MNVNIANSPVRIPPVNQSRQGEGCISDFHLGGPQNQFQQTQIHSMDRVFEQNRPQFWSRSLLHVYQDPYGIHIVIPRNQIAVRGSQSRRHGNSSNGPDLVEAAHPPDGSVVHDSK